MSKFLFRGAYPQPLTKSGGPGIAKAILNRELYATKPATMKLILESVKNFAEGFFSFYRNIYEALLK